MAPWAVAATRFRVRGGVADRLATGNQAGGGTASRVIGTVFPASFLRTPAVLLRGSHADGQCIDAERMATIRIIEHDIYGDVDYSQDILEERGQARTSRQSTSLFRIISSTDDRRGLSSEPAQHRGSDSPPLRIKRCGKNAGANRTTSEDGKELSSESEILGT